MENQETTAAPTNTINCYIHLQLSNSFADLHIICESLKQSKIINSYKK